MSEESSDELPELLTVKETAAYLRIPQPTVYYLVQRGELPAVQIGRRWRIKRSLLDRDVLRSEEGALPTVLVVDDDPGLQQLFREFLRRAGFARVVVGSAQEALAEAGKRRFDIAFVDLQLPDLGGDDLYLRLKELDAELPIVIITGYPDSEQLSRILRRGPVLVLQKPLDIDQLNQTIRILGHRSPA